MVRIYFIGVHGVGKTTTAKYLVSRLNGYSFHEMDCIEEVAGLSPTARQLLFFTTYVRQYLRTYRLGNVVVDSHPLLVIPYTLWWTKDKELADEFLRIVLRLPKCDYMIYLKPHDINILIRRIQERYRYNVIEEGQLDYINFIIEKTEDYLRRYGGLISNEVIYVNADMEVNERGDYILNKIDLRR